VYEEDIQRSEDRPEEVSMSRDKNDALMVHSISTNTQTNAMRFSHNSVQGHHHSVLGVERYADKGVLRWSMTVGCLLDPHSAAARYAAGAVLKRPILGLGMILGERGNTLVVSDLHLPYHHRDALDFILALDDYYDFDQVLNVGDLYDHHRGSYHESEVDAMGEEEEYLAARKAAHALQEILPDMVITQGNHDNIPARKAKSAGLPASVLKDMNAMYDTENTWKWCREHWFDSLGGFPITHPMVLNKRGRWDKVIMKLC